MPRHKWTPEEMVDVRSRAKMGFTYAEIASRYDVKEKTLASLVYRYALLTDEERAARRSLIVRGKKRSQKTRKAISDGMRRCWDSEEYRQRQLAVRKPPDAEMVRKFWDERRGFSIPDERKDEYQAVVKKGFTAREAGEMLGLIPPVSVSAGMERCA